MPVDKSDVKKMQVLKSWIRVCLQTERRKNQSRTWPELF